MYKHKDTSRVGMRVCMKWFVMSYPPFILWKVNLLSLDVLDLEGKEVLSREREAGETQDEKYKPQHYDSVQFMKCQ
jgi:hypothetical protein